MDHRKPKALADCLSRRDVVTALGAAAMGAGGGLLSGCVSTDRRGVVVNHQDNKELNELEKANEALVTQFCLDWSKRDAQLLADYLADDVVYQMFEGRPDILGREAFIKELDGFLQGLKEVEWEIVRSHAIGPLVINDRIDHFIGEDEGRSMHFAIAGYFLVKDGKIKVWRDFGLPGGISQVGGAFTGG